MTRARTIILVAAFVALLTTGALAWVLIAEFRGHRSSSAEVISLAASDQQANNQINHNIRKRPLSPRKFVANLPNEPDIEPDPAPPSAISTLAASAERALTPEEQDARNEAREKELFKEINALQAEMTCRRWAKALKLTDAQKQLTAPNMEKLRQLEIEYSQPPPLSEEALARLKVEADHAMQSGELTQDQANKRLNAQIMQLEHAQRDRIAGEQVETMESLRPYLDVAQGAKLDILVHGLKDSRNMVANMNTAATESMYPTSAKPAQ
jgi:hypothetical protein